MPRLLKPEVVEEELKLLHLVKCLRQEVAELRKEFAELLEWVKISVNRPWMMKERPDGDVPF